jgi:hypothetical protein
LEKGESLIKDIPTYVSTRRHPSLFFALKKWRRAGDEDFSLTAIISISIAHPIREETFP